MGPQTPRVNPPPALHGSPTRGAIVMRETMDGPRPAVWISDRYTGQQGHAARDQTCLAPLARDVAYVVVLHKPQDEGQRRSGALAPGNSGCNP
ncbi:hypothetical protein JCM2811A_29890 [Methylorubrum rhodinum]